MVNSMEYSLSNCRIIWPQIEFINYECPEKSMSFLKAPFHWQKIEFNIFSPTLPVMNGLLKSPVSFSYAL